KTLDGTGPYTAQTVTLNPDGTVPDSALHGPLAAGEYSFIAVYSGDRNYTRSSSPAEPLMVKSATPAAVTQITDATGRAIAVPYEVSMATPSRAPACRPRSRSPASSSGPSTARARAPTRWSPSTRTAGCRTRPCTGRSPPAPIASSLSTAATATT